MSSLASVAAVVDETRQPLDTNDDVGGYKQLLVATSLIEANYLHNAVIKDVVCFVGVQSTLSGCSFPLVYRYLREVVIPSRVVLPTWAEMCQRKVQHAAANTATTNIKAEMEEGDEVDLEARYHLYIARTHLFVTIATIQYILSHPDDLRLLMDEYTPETADSPSEDPSPLATWFTPDHTNNSNNSGGDAVEALIGGALKGLMEECTMPPYVHTFTTGRNGEEDGLNHLQDNLIMSMRLALDATYRRRVFLAPSVQLQQRTLGLRPPLVHDALVDKMGPPYPSLNNKSKDKDRKRQIIHKENETFAPYVYEEEKERGTKRKFRYEAKTSTSSANFSLQPFTTLMLNVVCESQGRGIRKVDIKAKTIECAEAHGMSATLAGNATAISLICLLETTDILTCEKVYDFEEGCFNSVLFLKMLSPRGTWAQPDVGGAFKAYRNLYNTPLALQTTDLQKQDFLSAQREEAMRYFRFEKSGVKLNGSGGRFISFQRNINSNRFHDTEVTPWGGAKGAIRKAAERDVYQRITLCKLASCCATSTTGGDDDAVTSQTKVCDVVVSSQLSQPLPTASYILLLLSRQLEDEMQLFGYFSTTAKTHSQEEGDGRPVASSRSIGISKKYSFTEVRDMIMGDRSRQLRGVHFGLVKPLRKEGATNQPAGEDVEMVIFDGRIDHTSSKNNGKPTLTVVPPVNAPDDQTCSPSYSSWVTCVVLSSDRALLADVALATHQHYQRQQQDSKKKLSAITFIDLKKASSESAPPTAVYQRASTVQIILGHPCSLVLDGLGDVANSILMMSNPYSIPHHIPLPAAIVPLKKAAERYHDWTLSKGHSKEGVQRFIDKEMAPINSGIREGRVDAYVCNELCRMGLVSTVTEIFLPPPFPSQASSSSSSAPSSTTPKPFVIPVSGLAPYGPWRTRMPLRQLIYAFLAVMMSAFVRDKKAAENELEVELDKMQRTIDNASLQSWTSLLLNKYCSNITHTSSSSSSSPRPPPLVQPIPISSLPTITNLFSFPSRSATSIEAYTSLPTLTFKWNHAVAFGRRTCSVLERSLGEYRIIGSSTVNIVQILKGAGMAVGSGGGGDLDDNDDSYDDDEAWADAKVGDEQVLVLQPDVDDEDDADGRNNAGSGSDSDDEPIAKKLVTKKNKKEAPIKKGTGALKGRKGTSELAWRIPYHNYHAPNGHLALLLDDPILLYLMATMREVHFRSNPPPTNTPPWICASVLGPLASLVTAPDTPISATPAVKAVVPAEATPTKATTTTTKAVKGQSTLKQQKLFPDAKAKQQGSTETTTTTTTASLKQEGAVKVEVSNDDDDDLLFGSSTTTAPIKAEPTPSPTKLQQHGEEEQPAEITRSKPAVLAEEDEDEEEETPAVVVRKITPRSKWMKSINFPMASVVEGVSAQSIDIFLTHCENKSYPHPEREGEEFENVLMVASNCIQGMDKKTIMKIVLLLTTPPPPLGDHINAPPPSAHLPPIDGVSPRSHLALTHLRKMTWISRQLLPFYTRGMLKKPNKPSLAFVAPQCQVQYKQTISAADSSNSCRVGGASAVESIEVWNARTTQIVLAIATPDHDHPKHCELTTRNMEAVFTATTTKLQSIQQSRSAVQRSQLATESEKKRVAKNWIVTSSDSDNNDEGDGGVADDNLLRKSHWSRFEDEDFVELSKTDSDLAARQRWKSWLKGRVLSPQLEEMGRLAQLAQRIGPYSYNTRTHVTRARQEMKLYWRGRNGFEKNENQRLLRLHLELFRIATSLVNTNNNLHQRSTSSSPNFQPPLVSIPLVVVGVEAVPPPMLAIVAPSIRFSLEHVAHNISLSAFCVVCGLTQELTPEEYFGGDTTTSQQQGGGRGGCGAINWAAPISNIPNVTLRQHCMAVVRRSLLASLSKMASRNILTCDPPIAETDIINSETLKQDKGHGRVLMGDDPMERAIYLHCTVPVDSSSLKWESVRAFQRGTVNQATTVGWEAALDRSCEDASQMFHSLVPCLSKQGWHQQIYRFLRIATLDEKASIIAFNAPVNEVRNVLDKIPVPSTTFNGQISEEVVASCIFKLWTTSSSGILLHEASSTIATWKKTRTLQRIQRNLMERANSKMLDILQDAKVQEIATSLHTALMAWKGNPTSSSSFSVEMRNALKRITPSALSLLEGVFESPRSVWDRNLWLSTWKDITSIINSSSTSSSVTADIEVTSPSSSTIIDYDAVDTLFEQLNEAALLQFPTAEQIIIISRILTVPVDELTHAFYIELDIKKSVSIQLSYMRETRSVVRMSDNASITSMLAELSGMEANKNVSRAGQIGIGHKRPRGDKDKEDSMLIASEWHAAVSSAHRVASKLRQEMGEGVYEGSVARFLLMTYYSTQRIIANNNSSVDSVDKQHYYQGLCTTTHRQEETTTPGQSNKSTARTQVVCTGRYFNDRWLNQAVTAPFATRGTGSRKHQWRNAVRCIVEMTALVPHITSIYLLNALPDYLLVSNCENVRVQFDTTPLILCILRQTCGLDACTDLSAFASMVGWNSLVHAGNKSDMVRSVVMENEADLHQNARLLSHLNIDWSEVVFNIRQAFSPSVIPSSLSTATDLLQRSPAPMDPFIPKGIREKYCYSSSNSGRNVAIPRNWAERTQAATEYLKMVCLSDCAHFNAAKASIDFGSRFTPLEQLAALVNLRTFTKATTSLIFDQALHNAFDTLHENNSSSSTTSTSILKMEALRDIGLIYKSLFSAPAPKCYAPDVFLSTERVTGVDMTVSTLQEAFKVMDRVGKDSDGARAITTVIENTYSSPFAAAQAAHALFYSIMRTGTAASDDCSATTSGPPTKALDIVTNNFVKGQWAATTYKIRRREAREVDNDLSDNNSEGDDSSCAEEEGGGAAVSLHAFKVPLVGISNTIVDCTAEEEIDSVMMQQSESFTTLPPQQLANSTTTQTRGGSVIGTTTTNSDNNNNNRSIWELRPQHGIVSEQQQQSMRSAPFPARDLLQTARSGVWLNALPVDTPVQQGNTPSSDGAPSSYPIDEILAQNPPKSSSDLAELLRQKWGLEKKSNAVMGVDWSSPDFLINPFTTMASSSAPSSPFISVFRHVDGSFHQFVFQTMLATVFDAIISKPGITFEEIFFLVSALNSTTSKNYSGVADVGGSSFVDASRIVFPPQASQLQTVAPVNRNMSHKGTIFAREHIRAICVLLERFMFIKRIPLSEGVRRRFTLRSEVRRIRDGVPPPSLSPTGGSKPLDAVDTLLRDMDDLDGFREKENRRYRNVQDGTDLSRENFETLLQGQSTDMARWMSKEHSAVDYIERSPFANTKNNSRRTTTTRIRGQKSVREEETGSPSSSVDPTMDMLPDDYSFIPTYDAAMRQSRLLAAVRGSSKNTSSSSSGRAPLTTAIGTHPNFIMFVDPAASQK